MKINKKYITPYFSVLFGAIISILSFVAVNVPLFEQTVIGLIGFLFMCVGFVWIDITEVRIMLNE